MKTIVQQHFVNSLPKLVKIFTNANSCHMESLALLNMLPFSCDPPVRATIPKILCKLFL